MSYIKPIDTQIYHTFFPQVNQKLTLECVFGIAFSEIKMFSNS